MYLVLADPKQRRGRFLKEVEKTILKSKVFLVNESQT